MLTKTDLSQIRKIIREEVETEVSDAKKTLESLIRISKLEVKSQINDVDDRLKNVEIGVDMLGKDMKNVKKDLKFLRETANLIIKNFEEADIILKKRVEKIEEHLGI